MSDDEKDLETGYDDDQIDDGVLSEDELETLTSIGIAPNKSNTKVNTGQSSSGSNGNTNPPTATNPPNYANRKIGLIPFINEFQRDYTINCFKRTTPLNYTLPFSFGRILLGVSALSKGSSTSESIPLREAVTFLGTKEGGGMKTGDTVRKDLCRMTADPFPLLQSAKDKNETGDYRPTPLYSMATGFCSAEKYSKVGLSYLGEIAVGKYYKLYGKNIKKIKSIKTLVPLALLRKKTVPWTLGHKAVNYSYNPAELFTLQAKMLDAAADPNNAEPWILPDSDVAEVFKGPDVGDGYEGYMTNRSLMSTYHLAKGSMTVVPEIKIDRTMKTIEFVVPPLGMISNDFIMYLSYKSIGYTDPKTKRYYPKFKSFEFTRTIDESGVRVILRDVIFHTSIDDEIINELHGDPVVRVTTPLINTVILNDQDEIEANDLEENVQDSASNNFSVDVMPIHELLWRHIIDEYEVRLEILEREIADLRDQLEVDLFLEKVTRPAVADYITSINTRQNTHKFRTMLFEKFSTTSSTHDKAVLPEGFLNWEIDEIATESAKGGRTGLNILRAMLNRAKYEDRWKNTMDQLDRLNKKHDNPSVIYGEIKSDLLRYAMVPYFRRKTKMHFIEEIKISDTEIDYDFTFNTETWDNLYLPCTLYHNGRYLVKSYGRNINYIPQSEKDANMMFSESLNATTDDTFYIFTKDSFQDYHMSQVPCYPIDVGNIEAIIPHSDDKDILVTIESMVYNEDLGKRVLARSSFFVIPAGGPKRLTRLGSDDRIKGWCYLDKKYVEVLGYDPVMDKQSYGRILTEQIPRCEEVTPFPRQFDPITDIKATNDDGQGVCLVSKSFDGTVLGPNEVFVQWTQEDTADTLHLIHEGEFVEYFGSHIEYYIEKLYMSDWKKINMVVHEYYTHGKKAVLNELIWCRPNDDVSSKLDNLIAHKATSFRGGMNLMISHCTSNYEDYNVGYLSDWSVINPRFQLPTCRPEEDDIVEFYNNYLEKMYTCNVDRKEFKQICKQMDDVRARIIASVTHNPFISESHVNVPTMDFTDVDYTDDEGETE